MWTRDTRTPFWLLGVAALLAAGPAGAAGAAPAGSHPAETYRAGALLFVPDFGSHTVSVVDLDGLEVVRTIPAGPGPGIVAVGESSAWVGHRGSAELLQIRLSDLAIVDTLDLSARMAFPCGVAVTAEGDLCVVGRRHLYAKETDQAVLVVVRPSGEIREVVALPDVQGDTHPDDPLFAFKNLGVGIDGLGRAIIPWCRSFENATGVVIHDLSTMQTEFLSFDPFAHGYFRAGVGIGPDGAAWLASWRYLSRVYRVTGDGLAVVANPSCPEEIWLYLDIAATNAAGCVAGYGEGGGSVVQVQGASSICRPTGLANPAGIARDDLGRIWIAHPATGRVYGYDQAWNLVGSVAVGDVPAGFGDMSGAEALRLPVPNFGACCLGAFCTLLPEPDCWGSLGTFQGAGVPCDPNPCWTSGLSNDPPGGVRLDVQTPAVRRCAIGAQAIAPEGGMIAVVDILGRSVRHFTIPAGESEIRWDLCDDRGNAVRSGRYFVSLESGGRRLCRSVTILR